MTVGTENTKWGEVLMVMPTGEGHVTPLMYVAKGLMERGVSITVVVTEDQRGVAEKKVDSKYLEAGGLMNFELVKVGNMGPKDDGLKERTAFMERVSEPHLEKLLADQKSGNVRMPKCIVADQFSGWTQVWANKLGIPRYVSFPSPAVYAVAMLRHRSVECQLEHASEQEDPDFVVNLPRLPLELHKTDLPKSFLSNTSFRTEIVDRNGDSFKEAAGILFNTFYELEREAIDAFQASVAKMNAPGKVTRLLPIGPMLPPAFFKEAVFEDETAKNNRCIQWLDSRPASSVLYIAFGSWAYLTPHQIEELATALEATKVPFLWILRLQGSPDESKSVEDVLPPGFLECTQHQGFVYSEFAPQLHILSHPSTGGFLTHCGWNSSLESICRGVPMVGWPNKAEQGLCCRVLVDLAKVAIEVTKGENELAGRKDLEKAITVLMKEPQGQELKRRATELQRLARAAVSPGGSSHGSLEQFVKDICEQP
ncbi:unnamed protein product [Calypogeia fissa]